MSIRETVCVALVVDVDGMNSEIAVSFGLMSAERYIRGLLNRFFLLLIIFGFCNFDYELP